MNKVCKDCSMSYPPEFFKSDMRATDNLATVCNYCIKKREKRILDPGEYEARYIQQKFRCKICNCKVYLSKILVDCDPQTDEIKGLLCVRCNRLLRQVGRDVRVLTAAAEYLDPSQFKGRQRSSKKIKGELEIPSYSKIPRPTGPPTPITG